MDKLLLVLERLAPEAIELIDTRYRILRHVYYHEPIGRRQLCKELKLSERTVRNCKLARGAVFIRQVSTSAHQVATASRTLAHCSTLSLISSPGQKIKQSFHIKSIIVPGMQDYLSHRTGAGCCRL